MNKKILPILLLGASLHASEKHEDHPDHKAFKVAMHNVGAVLHVARPIFQSIADANLISKEHSLELLLATDMINKIYKIVDEGSSNLFHPIPNKADKPQLSGRSNPVVPGEAEHLAEELFLNHGAGDAK